MRPLLHSRSPCRRRRDLALPELLQRAEPASPRSAKDIGQLLFDCRRRGRAEGMGVGLGEKEGEGEGGCIRMASHLL